VTRFPLLPAISIRAWCQDDERWETFDIVASRSLVVGIAVDFNELDVLVVFFIFSVEIIDSVPVWHEFAAVPARGHEKVNDDELIVRGIDQVLVLVGVV